MPKIDNAKTSTFDNNAGVHFTPIASPSRGTSESAVWRARVLPGNQGLLHHMTREEIIVAMAGECVVTVGEQTYPLRPGDAFAVPPFVDFKLECAGSEAFEAMIVLPVGGRAVVGAQPSFAPPWSL